MLSITDHDTLSSYIDFIKYSLEDKSICNFIKELNNIDDGIKIKIIGKIEQLYYQDYDGERVYITLTDKNHYSISPMVKMPMKFPGDT